MLELGKRDSRPSLLALTCWFAARELLLLEVEIRWPGHIFYLFNYVSQQNFSKGNKRQSLAIGVVRNMLIILAALKI